MNIVLKEVFTIRIDNASTQGFFMSSNNLVVTKSFDFAVDIIDLYDYLVTYKNEFVLSKQLLRSGTSIGANVREALGGQSRKDFIFKMNIALKEAYETEYWIELLIRTNKIKDNSGEKILRQSREISRILHSIVKTSKSN